MMRHETERLWALAADELPIEDRRYVELHLQECPECQDALDAVSVARRTLDSARRSSPSIDWIETDSKVGALVERQLRQRARPTWVPYFATGSLLAAAAAATFFFWPAAEPMPVEELAPLVPLVEVAPVKPTRVEVARGVTLVSAQNEAVVAGDVLRDGDVLRTGVAGKAFVQLADSSFVRVAAATQVVLNKTHADEVELTLARGRLAVLASHESRKSFVVRAQDVTVHVVGTEFVVESGRDGVSVAVSEGAVRVESGSVKETLVKAGQRFSIDNSGRGRLNGLPRAMERELSEVRGVADAVTPPPVVAPPAAVAARGGPLPRLSAAESKARQVEPLAAEPVAVPPKVPDGTTVVLEPKTEVEVVRDGPGTAFPSLAGGFTRTTPMPREDVELPSKPQGPVTEESEWAALPKAVPPPTLVVPALDTPAEHRAEPKVTPAPAPVPAPAPSAASKTLEQVFLEKAQAAIAQGGCERFLPGLEDMVLEGSSSAELARVMRARCFDAQLRPRQAMSEYVKYLEAYPRGRFSGEAKAALGQ